MASDALTLTGTSASTHKAAPQSHEKHCVKSWLISNHDEANYASCVLLSGTTVIAGPCYVPPGASVPVPFGYSEDLKRGSNRARGVECALGESLGVQQLNSSNTGTVSSTVCFETEAE